MKTWILLLSINLTYGGDIIKVSSGDLISATKMNEVIDGVNNAGA